MAEIILHVRNIPCKVLETSFQETMQEVGLDVSRYELYFPKKVGRQGRYNNYGYCFVTCWSTEDAEAFIRTMDGFRFENINSHKHLIIEPARNNVQVEPVDEAFGQPGALDAVRALTPVTYDWESTHSPFACSGISTASAYFPGNSSSAEHDAEFPVAHEGPQESLFRSGFEAPRASQVPPTYLAVDERSLTRSMVDSTKELADASSRTLFRFQ
eukprot:TRINITY_DN23024_c1_g1_i1.p1 TRINITY_DN23024_c1_g1~~TRINITY_DN23024_c1_g1_i1.p1  ORF type:complete len:229 (-),score=29.76 TRINITY_DN23024_c1_g1_i1:427-1068(-)